MTASLAGQSIEAARRMLAARLKSGSIESAELDARMLVGAGLGIDLTGMIRAAGRLLTPDESNLLESFARRRLAGEPVARIVGHKEFWGLPLNLSPATLVPRPDTETVVEMALQILAGREPIGRCASPISAPARARSCWRCCPNCRAQMGSAPIFPRRPCRPRAAMPRGWDCRIARYSSLAIMQVGCRAPST
jgi:hypothetical protein